MNNKKLVCASLAVAMGALSCRRRSRAVGVQLGGEGPRGHLGTMGRSHQGEGLQLFRGVPVQHPEEGRAAPGVDQLLERAVAGLVGHHRAPPAHDRRLAERRQGHRRRGAPVCLASAARYRQMGAAAHQAGRRRCRRQRLAERRKKVLVAKSISFDKDDKPGTKKSVALEKGTGYLGVVKVDAKGSNAFDYKFTFVKK